MAWLLVTLAVAKNTLAKINLWPKSLMSHWGLHVIVSYLLLTGDGTWVETFIKELLTALDGLFLSITKRKRLMQWDYLMWTKACFAFQSVCIYMRCTLQLTFYLLSHSGGLQSAFYIQLLSRCMITYFCGMKIWEWRIFTPEGTVALLLNTVSVF